MNSLFKISDLISYIHKKDSSIQSIARFLVLDTFSEVGAVGIFLGFPQIDGYPIISSNFGIEEILNSGEIFEIAGSLTRPFHRKEKGDGFVRFSKEEILSSNKTRNGKKTIFPLGFQFTIESPAPYSQTGLIFFDVEPVITPETESLLKAVAIVIASHNAVLMGFEPISSLGSTRGAPGEKGEKGEKGSAGGEGDLTSRQLVILGEIRRGKSNATIANDLDYSESLIRQEAIEIYRKMGITGRKALVNSELPEGS